MGHAISVIGVALLAVKCSCHNQTAAALSKVVELGVFVSSTQNKALPG